MLDILRQLADCVILLSEVSIVSVISIIARVMDEFDLLLFSVEITTMTNLSFTFTFLLVITVFVLCTIYLSMFCFS